MESKVTDKKENNETILKKIPIISSNQLKQLKAILKEILQENLEINKKKEIIKLFEKDLNQIELESLKEIVLALPDEVFDKINKRLSNINKSIKKTLKQTCVVDKTAKIKNLIIEKESLDEELEKNTNIKIESLEKISDKVLFYFNNRKKIYH